MIDSRQLRITNGRTIKQIPSLPDKNSGCCKYHSTVFIQNPSEKKQAYKKCALMVDQKAKNDLFRGSYFVEILYIDI